jgi:hypothetical protein
MFKKKLKKHHITNTGTIVPKLKKKKTTSILHDITNTISSTVTSTTSTSSNTIDTTTQTISTLKKSRPNKRTRSLPNQENELPNDTEQKSEVGKVIINLFQVIYI